MADESLSARLLNALRQEFVPALQSCASLDQLPDVISRLAKTLGADGGIVWRVEDGTVLPQLPFGIVDAAWAERRATSSAGAHAWKTGESLQVAGAPGVYQSSETGVNIAQVAAIPVRGQRESAGAVELWWKSGRNNPPDLTQLFPELEQILQQTLPVLLANESERNMHIQAISRLMMLYDVGKVFHSTLDLNDLAPIIITRVQSLMNAEGAALWLVDNVKKNFYCAAVEGPNRDAIAPIRIWASDPGLGEDLSSGRFVALHDVEDAAWTNRWGSPIRSLFAIPLQQEGRFLGAIEAVRGANADYFSEEDARLLKDVAKQAAVALRNAQRLEAERQVKELHALMEISKEITATLDIDRVLSSTVNRITGVVPVDRASISLMRKGRVELSALSGEMKVDRAKPGVKDLDSLHEWFGGFSGDVTAEQTDESVSSDPEDARDRVASYFDKSGMHGLTALQLRDEEGLVGVLVLESKEAQTLTPGHKDLARIFANQVTSAIRNALLYQEVPLIGVLQPFIDKKKKFSALPANRQRVILIGGALALAFLIFFPWWSKPSGEAKVLPGRVLPISSDLEGVVQHVLVNEGDHVSAGQEIAELDPGEQQVAFEQARSQRDILYRHVMQLESEGNLAAARSERARLDHAEADLDLQRTRLGETKILSPISGVVLTPRLDQRVGQFLKRGEVFCQVGDLDRAWVEIIIPEGDVAEIRAGEESWVKLNTFPSRRFDGKVIRVSPQGREVNDERVFDVTVEVPNADGSLRAGMMGRGKVLAERASAGYLLARGIIRWFWIRLWKWAP